MLYLIPILLCEISRLLLHVSPHGLIREDYILCLQKIETFSKRKRALLNSRIDTQSHSLTPPSRRIFSKAHFEFTTALRAYIGLTTIINSYFCTLPRTEVVTRCIPSSVEVPAFQFVILLLSRNQYYKRKTQTRLWRIRNLQLECPIFYPHRR